MVDRRFWVADGRRAEFEAVFGLGGSWTSLLREADGYLRTQVWCESAALRKYRVRDFWSWHRRFQELRERFSEELVRFERDVVAPLIEKQEFVGGYYEAGDANFEIT